ncbi:RES family NAD+ phosphorylase [Lysobacter sp. GX 14042]|uniref:RES family NAD+ phosphorylase n=1 Tax=Lysobacter sp. GX 14042 TaxID=2907155 RepID=UPI001F4423CC|nr:RES family NAD+ phosphorylase [Lysobacter sp. GX 14042]MCE7031964.1 RES family NAD+ phosphorylase [Lysobacter sp. GX 14042]
MRYSRLGVGTPLYRAHNPRWASQPMSGAGAARSGGRFNRQGIEALYLSLDIQTSAAEYRQDDPLSDPFTLITYVSELPDLVDLRLLDDTWDPLWHDWGTDWRQMFVDGLEPPSWALGDMLRDGDEIGLIFPSLAEPAGLNVVLFNDRLEPEWLAAHDPKGLIPTDQSSWAA